MKSVKNRLAALEKRLNEKKGLFLLVLQKSDESDQQSIDRVMAEVGLTEVPG